MLFAAIENHSKLIGNFTTVGEQDKNMSEIKSCNNDDIASGVELVNGKKKPMPKTYRDVLVNS